jgi:hypothetical protein
MMTNFSAANLVNPTTYLCISKNEQELSVYSTGKVKSQNRARVDVTTMMHTAFAIRRRYVDNLEGRGYVVSENE